MAVSGAFRWKWLEGYQGVGECMGVMKAGTHARTRTDQARLSGSEHSVSRREERVAAFSVFESMSMNE